MDEILGIDTFSIVDFPPEGENVKMMYKGENSAFKAKFCFINLGNLELEIIQPLEGDTVWGDFLKGTNGMGLHHLKFLVPEHGRGGALVDFGSHMVDTLYNFLLPSTGQITQIMGLKSTHICNRINNIGAIPAKVTSPDSANVIMKTENGALLTLTCSRVGSFPSCACDIRMFENADILSPNETEAEKLTGVIINNIEDAIKARRILLENGIDKVVLLMIFHYYAFYIL